MLATRTEYSLLVSFPGAKTDQPHALEANVAARRILKIINGNEALWPATRLHVSRNDHFQDDAFSYVFYTDEHRGIHNAESTYLKSLGSTP